ncbi:MAG: hypothetical protein AVDCRST_MAG93-7466 [uncultured Chloroflexia bacterium]|uniref:Uncharacterized protein n=1 Tax=uncultured Chloroflexia bacterium TaxID=1672391 RepID=A0A6J4MGN4_9CHLR|nr:MAG: hypothetical protein AVDCRST_MAG93-7466 [uncultured Chloroflexia bacterium]
MLVAITALTVWNTAYFAVRSPVNGFVLTRASLRVYEAHTSAVNDRY